MTEDHAWQVLQDVCAARNVEIDAQLLRACYDTQKHFQFDKGREAPLAQMRRLVEHAVDKLVGEDEGQLQ